MKKTIITVIVVVVISLVALGAIGFAIYNNFKDKGQPGIDDMGGNEVRNYDNVEKNPVVTMEMENGGIVKIELYPKIAPQTVENFISLVQSGFYNGLTFHRVIPEFVAQGGDPDGDGTGGPGYNIYGEFSANGFENNLKHEVGVISMARGNDEYNTAGSQFFIVTNENSYLSLDTLYAGFGKVIEGMEVVNEIVNTPVIRKDYSEELYKQIEDEGGQITTTETYNRYIQETNEMNRPVEAPVIKSMTVDTFGYEYGEPTKYNVE